MKRLSVGNGALALRFIGDRESFNGVEHLQQVDRNRGRIGMHGKADGTGRRVACNGAVSVAVGRFQHSHEESQGDAQQRDHAHQLAGIELALRDHFYLRAAVRVRPLASKPAYSNFHSLTRVCIVAGGKVFRLRHSRECSVFRYRSVLRYQGP